MHRAKVETLTAPPDISFGDPFGDEPALVIGDRQFAIVLPIQRPPDWRRSASTEHQNSEKWNQSVEKFHARTMAVTLDAGKCGKTRNPLHGAAEIAGRFCETPPVARGAHSVGV